MAQFRVKICRNNGQGREQTVIESFETQQKQDMIRIVDK